MFGSYKEANARERFVSLVTVMPCKAIASHSHGLPLQNLTTSAFSELKIGSLCGSLNNLKSKLQ